MEASKKLKKSGVTVPLPSLNGHAVFGYCTCVLLQQSCNLCVLLTRNLYEYKGLSGMYELPFEICPTRIV